MDQKHMPLLEALEKFRDESPAYFRIPAHRFLKGLNPALTGKNLAALDLSEAEGLDDLHQAEGPIREAQDLAAELFHARHTFFLVNGTTCGNEAMVLSTVQEGDKIIVPRNVHKSVLMGLIMSGATPVYVMPEYLEEWNLWGSVAPETIEEAFRREPESRAVLLVSPTYYGIASDLEESRKSATATARCFLWMKPMVLICIFRSSCPKVRLHAEQMPWHRVSIRRQDPLHRVPCSTWVPTGLTGSGWQKISTWYRARPRPTF